MPRGETAKKQQTHERIVRTAAAAIRKHGFDGISVADVMKEAGLTHGGFYAHFESKDAMLAEALDEAAGDAMGRLAKAADHAKPEAALDATVNAYLSDRHVTEVERGCTLAALGSETGRQSPEVRRVATRRVRELADLIERQMPEWGKTSRHEDALGAMCTLVGALLIARAVDDPQLSKDVRAAAKRLIGRGTGK
ncbi:MAG: TetR/AcrR family transcriptional regulator [Deltaproteobacteria bacterium]|nr:TetR/AcrR family transcriptional regulator [Deltaproteobacteria bacterium]MCW5802429.1 TetR/AcrR family transcriptional regulator [Deltaproteobacteria bacterium]